jgi:EmrB/QacA subfamily drug resistance transporter
VLAVSRLKYSSASRLLIYQVIYNMSHMKDAPATSPSPYPPLPRVARNAPWAALIVMIAAAFMDLLDGTIVEVGLPSIQRSLHVDGAGLQWTVSAYTLAFAVLMITGARFGERIGRRRSFLAGLAAFTICSAAVAAAQSTGMLIGFRAAQGAAAALMLPQVLTFIQSEFEPGAKPKAFALYGMILALAGAAGPLLGGVLIEADPAGLGWRAIFLVNVPVGIAALALGARMIPGSLPDRTKSLDPAGTLVLVAALVALFYPLIEGRQLGWPAWSIVVLAAAVPLLVVFVLTQMRRGRAAPLVDLSVFRSRATSSGLTIGLVLFGSTSFFFVLTLYLQNGLAYSALRTGVTFLPFAVGIIFGSAAAAPLGQRFGRAAIAAGAAGITAALASLLAVIGIYGTGLHAWQLAPSLAGAGIAFGIVSGTLANIVLGQVPARLAGSASGVVSTITQLGSVVAVTVTGVIFFGALGDHPLPETFVRATTHSLWYLTASCAAAAVGCTLLPALGSGASTIINTPDGPIEATPADP